MSYLYRGKNMEVNGTLINYYFHCQRQCYLHGNRLNLEDESENVKIGKALHEEKYKDDKSSEIAIDNIRLDKLTTKYLTETKKSDADLVAAKWQLLYYLKVLKSKGIIRKGRIQVIEKNKQNKSYIEVELTEAEEKELDKLIENFLKLEKIDKMYLYRLINKIEIDKDKNVYIYFNFSKLNSINENLDEFIKIEEIINDNNQKRKAV